MVISVLWKVVFSITICQALRTTQRIRKSLCRRTTVKMSEGEIKQYLRLIGRKNVKKAGGSFGGSGWSSTAKWEADDGESFFVKTSSQACDKMFDGESKGLTAMRLAAENSKEGPQLKIPKVIHCSDYDNKRGSYIIMEFLNMKSGGANQKEFGIALAKMHAAPGGEMFGFLCDNTCGTTPQPNGWMDDWPTFFAEKRIKHQINLAGDASIDRLGKLLIPRIPEFFDDGEIIKPSIIHGDLWSGNIGTADGMPTIFDPACYYAHHEAEWGMSWCASFSPEFWKGYREIIPEAPGFKKRRPLYELYHQLNHYNLFGGGYRNTACGLMEQCLRSLDEN